MKKFFLFAFLVQFFFVSAALAQDIFEKKKSDDEVKTLLSSRKHFGFYCAPVFKAGQSFDRTTMFTGGKIGLVAGRALGFGFEGYGAIPDAARTDLLPATRLRTLTGMGGFFVEPILASNRLVHLTFPVGTGIGWCGYVTDWVNNNDSDRLLEEDLYWYVEPSVNIEMNITRFLRAGASVSYRYTSDIKMTGLDAKTLAAPLFGAYFKIGRF